MPAAEFPDDLDRLMRMALELAAGEHPHPNPRVGAVVVDRRGRVVGRGAHVRPGTAHAEPLALADAGPDAQGATLIVTLEPHDHHGRTPPCTEAILGAGIARVVVGALDPNPLVSGKGIERLRRAGVDVVAGVASEAVEDADPGYFHWHRTGRARFIHKAAVTLDGQTAAIDGSSQWITTEQARADAHRLRSEVDGIMVGAGTLIEDDPRLTVRLVDHTGPQPRPIVVAGTRRLPADAAVWNRNPVVLSPVPMDVPGDVLVLPAEAGAVDLAEAARRLPELGILYVMVEGGATVAGSMLQAGLIDEGMWYLGAKLAGGIGTGVFDRAFASIDDAIAVDIVDVRTVGADLRVRWRPRRR